MIRPIAELLGGCLADAGLESTSDIWRIAESWPALVGERIAAHATPSRLVRGELVIATPDAVWRQELAFLGPEIIAKVNRQFDRGVVTRIRLVAGDPLPPDVPRGERRLLRRPAEPDGEPATLPAETARLAVRTSLRADLAAAFASLSRVREERLTRDQARRRERPPRGVARRPV